ncbi:HK97-gp10 family putative phage morphogenesis protein [Pseudomonas sp. TTU2014-080ASC]|uniref:HK97-gp10 family putative phage morphogenesis protein n=1 Tax=Pseudomonas sp. TTU2014-080ASC TaxID=1729724 RepID=UPI00071840B1|nr:HK97-gp10 family putative phage morphogenesis protein [Pseudomonas sp. TTU2014-080ASC]KRW62338.1 hypothetical protein AO726_02635 [Pseudomonas sp. TTU2014-080ASC]
MARRSRVRGDFKLRGVLRRLANIEQSDLPPAMAKAADLVLAAQQQLIPKDTGAAAAALQVRISKNGLDARIGIVGKADNRRFFYLRFVEYGTKGYTAKLKQGQSEKTNKSDGEAFFGYSPTIPAMPAHPWLRPSIQLTRDDIRLIISEAVRSTLARAAKGASYD